MSTFNSLGTALAMAGVCDHAAASQRKAAWQLREPNRGERFKAALFNAEAAMGHKLSRFRAKRRKKYKVGEIYCYR